MMSITICANASVSATEGRKMTPTESEARAVMKRCQRGFPGHMIDESNGLHADCFGIIGKLLHERTIQLRAARLEGLKYALNITQGRRILNRPPSYLACVDEMEIFLQAAIERVEAGEDMGSVAVTQTP